MASVRELRGLVPVEIAVVIAAAVAPMSVPAVVPLLVAASLSLWLRGRSWLAVLAGPPSYAAIGALAGLAALALAIGIGTPLVEGVTGHAVQWSTYPVVRGNSGTFVMVALVVGVSAVAAELVLRGWLVERVLELGASPLLAIGAGALAQALVTPGDVAVRIGAGVFGVAMGWMFVAGNRSALAPLCAHAAFAIGALALEAARVIG